MWLGAGRGGVRFVGLRLEMADSIPTPSRRAARVKLISGAPGAASCTAFRSHDAQLSTKPQTPKGIFGRQPENAPQIGYRSLREVTVTAGRTSRKYAMRLRSDDFPTNAASVGPKR